MNEPLYPIRKKKSDKTRILEVFRKVEEEGRTTKELEKELKIGHPTATGRINELYNAGLIKMNGKKRDGCSIYVACAEGEKPAQQARTKKRNYEDKEVPTSSKKFWQFIREYIQKFATHGLKEEIEKVAPHEYEKAFVDLEAGMQSVIGDFQARFRPRPEVINFSRRKVLDACLTLNMDYPKPGERADLKMAKTRKRRLAATYHADTGGDSADNELFQRVIEAFDALEAYNKSIDALHGTVTAEETSTQEERTAEIKSAVGPKLGDICIKISCGVATGADGVFVKRTKHINDDLLPFGYPTIKSSQLEIGKKPKSKDTILVPYNVDGQLRSLEDIGKLGEYLSLPGNKHKLDNRSCVRRGRPWYGFHDNLRLGDFLRPKLLCKDNSKDLEFWVDREGVLLPRHSIYCIVPRDPSCLEDLAAYLNSEEARNWLRKYCKRDRENVDLIRFQNEILKLLPVPETLA